MTVKEMCAKYDIRFQTVYKKISRHKDKELKGHIRDIKGKSIYLDDFAVDFLKPQKLREKEMKDERETLIERIHNLNETNRESYYECKDWKQKYEQESSRTTELENKLDSEKKSFEKALSEKESEISRLTDENEALKRDIEALRKEADTKAPKKGLFGIIG